MLILRAPLGRLSAALILLGLLAVSVLFIKNIVTTAWGQDQQEQARYRRAPNCFPHQDPSEVDAALPPCQDVTLSVAAKPENTTIDHYRSRDYTKMHRRLTLRDGRGWTQTVGDIPQDMWDSIKVGDPVSATLWQGQVQDMTSNGYHASIVDMRGWERAEARLWPWIALGLACSCALTLLWRYGAGRSL